MDMQDKLTSNSADDSFIPPENSGGNENIDTGNHDVQTREGLSPLTPNSNNEPDNDSLPSNAKTSDMEVHHHSHTERKKWTHYFWEFFMLFLAVTLGFLVENQREHYIEEHRAHEFAESLVADLKSDTANLNNYLKEIDFVVPRIDTFRAMVHTTPLSSVAGGRWYYYARFTIRYFSFNSNDATVEQLKNSGSLRYFRNKEVIKAIGQYDKLTRSIKELNIYEQPVLNKTTELVNKIFNITAFNPISSLATRRETIDSFMKKEIPFLNPDASLLNELANYCELRVLDYHERRNYYLQALKSGTHLIQLLEEEYDLK